jgi:hypothetical protein
MTPIYRLGALCAVAIAAPATAQTRGGFEVGPKVVDYSYREMLDGATIVRDDGLLYGLAVGYTETLSRGWFLRLRADAVTGNVDYEDDEGERIENVSQTAGTAEFHLGKDFAVGGATLTPFAGIGHRTLRDESGGRETQGGLAGYDRTISYRYLPVGVAVSFGIGASARMELSGQANFVVGGRARSRLSEIDPDLPDLDLALRGGTGFRLSALGEIPIGGSAIRFGPVLETWTINPSESLQISEGGDTFELSEPRNRTVMVGAMASFAF